MASIATGIDYETQGRITSTGADMRERQPDQVGGTDSRDAVMAWSTYGARLTVRDGSSWDRVIQDLADGRLVHLDVWHATVGGPCLSGSGRYGHTIPLAPEMSSDGLKVLVADPWCRPARWTWWPLSRLRAGAEHWGAIVSGVGLEVGGRAEAVLMSLHTPASPEIVVDELTETGGYAEGGPILYTVTHRPEDDMAIQAAPGLTSGYRLDLPANTDVYEDADLVTRMTRKGPGTFVYVGPPIGESVPGGSRAIVVNTSQPYHDGTARLTVGYVPASVGAPYAVPAPLPPDVAKAVAERDAEWREWLLAGSPGDEP